MADLSFKIKANVQELDNAYKKLDEIEKKIKSLNGKLSSSNGTGAFKEINKQISALEKAYDKVFSKIAKLETSTMQQAQQQAGATNIITQSINQAIQSEKLKNETSKASIQASKEKIATLKLELEERKKQRAMDNEVKKRAVTEQELTKILNTQAQSIRQAEEQNRRLRMAVKDVVGEDQKAMQTRQKLNNQISANTEFIRRNSDAYVRQKMNVGQYTDSIKIAYNQIKNGEGGLKSFGVIASNTGKLLKTQLTSSLNEVSVSFGSMVKGIVGAQAILTGMRAAFNQIKEGFKSMVAFEASTSKLAAILGDTKKNINDLVFDAKRLGSVTRYTASEVTALQTELAKLGFTKVEILQSTSAVLKFAQATGSELSEAAALAGASIRMFGATTQETEKYVASMAIATTKSALSFQYLATAMPIVGPVAKAFNFSIEDTLALLGKLADSGFDASMAATATRNIFLNMADGSGKLAKALGDSVKTFPELVKGLQTLRDKGIDLATTLELTDKRSVAAFNSFLIGADSLNTLKDSITGVEGALGKMANEMTDNLQGSVLGLQSAWEAFMLSFMNSTGPAKSVIDFFAQGLREIAYNLSSPDERQNTQNANSVEIQKQQMQEFNVVQENIIRLRDLYNEKITAGIEANEAERQAKEEYLSRYQSDLEKERNLYQQLADEKAKTQEKYQNASFWKQALFLEKTNAQFEKQIDLQVSSMAQLKGSMFKNETIIDSVNSTPLAPTSNNASTIETGAQRKQRDEAAKQLAYYTRLLDSQAIERQRANEDLENKVSQSRINAMQDGFIKEQAQRKLNQKTEIHNLQRQKEDYIKKLQSIEKAKFEANPANEGKSYSGSVSLSNDETTAFNDMSKAVNDKHQLENKKAYDDLIKLQEEMRLQHASQLEKQLADIDAYYTDVIKMAEDNEELLNKINENRNKDRDIAIGENQLSQNSFNANMATGKIDLNFSGLGMDDFAEQKKLESLKDYAKERISILQSLGDEQSKMEIDALNQTIDGYDKALSKPKTTKQIFDEKVFKSVEKHFAKTAESAEEAEKKTANFFQGFADAGAIATDVIGTMQGLFGGVSEELDMALNAAMNIAQGFAKGGLIGGIEAAAAQLISITADLLFAKREIDKSMIEGYEAYIDAIDRTIEKQTNLMESLGGSAFNENIEKSYNDLLKRMQASRRLFEEAMKAGSGVFSHSDGYKANKMLKQNAQYLREAGIYTTDLNGMTNEQLISLMDIEYIWARLPENLRKYISDLADAKDQISDINDQLQDMLLGFSAGDITSAIVDAFRSGDIDNAMGDLSNKLDQFISGVVSNIIVKMALTEPITKAVQDLMKGIANYNSDGSISGFKNVDDIEAGVLAKFKETVTGLAEGFGSTWKELSQEFEKAGINLNDTSSSKGQDQASSRGFQSMSQDTGNELNGRFTALQVAGEDIKAQSIIHTELLTSINAALNGDLYTPSISTPDNINNNQVTVDLTGLNERLIEVKLLIEATNRTLDEHSRFMVEDLLEQREIVDNLAIVTKRVPQIESGINNINSGFGRL